MKPEQPQPQPLIPSSNDETEDDTFDLLSQVTGLGDTNCPSDDDFAEANRLITDPNIPCSDLRGLRDHQYTGDLADAWHTGAFPSERESGE